VSRVASIDVADGEKGTFPGNDAEQIGTSWILDVDGTPLVIEANWSAASPRVDVAEKRTILGSIRVEIELRLIDLATGSVSPVTEGEPRGELEAGAFTPQGDRILFSKTAATGWSLWSVGVDGSDAHLIVDGTDGNFYRVPSSPKKWLDHL
jgi:Tol biopolymer transport system component